MQSTLNGVKQLLTNNTAEHTEVEKYIINPHEARLSKSTVYRWLKVLKMPSSRELTIFSKALKIMRSKEISEETIEMNMLLSHPECSQWLLNLIMKTCLS